ncbi:MAG: ADP-forming succinate--CoA ligase subunit beta [Pseudomonadota bacterium]
MNIHEYQAKALLHRYGIPVPEGRAVLQASAASAAAAELDGPTWIVKAQIHAGGRGLGRFVEPGAGPGGGVRTATSAEAAAAEAKRMLGRTLRTAQSGPDGKQVNRVYIETGIRATRALYLALLIDRPSARIAFLAAPEGGMDIETSTAPPPLSLSIDPASGYQNHHGRRLAFALGLTGAAAKQCVVLMGALYRLFVEKDLEMLEVNPLVVTDAGDLCCLDAKMAFDANALFRHPDILRLADDTEVDALELAAQKHGFHHIALDGEIGCLVNGAGLAMATMDLIALEGGAPANFLDIGGGATPEKVAEAFKIMTADAGVKGIFVNIFGGIMRCDIVAEGIVAAVEEVGLAVPLVVRLEGTNVSAGKRILRASGLDVIPADDLGDGAAKIVAAVARRPALATTP